MEYISILGGCGVILANLSNNWEVIYQTQGGSVSSDIQSQKWVEKRGAT